MAWPLDGNPIDTPRRTKTSPEQVMSELLDWLKYIVSALAVGLLIVTFVIQNNRVIGISMEPTLSQGDQLLVQKVSAQLGSFHYGDIVTISGEKLLGEEEPDLVKRVIGLAGDAIEIRDGRVYRNGIPLDEDYLAAGLKTYPLERGYDSVTLQPNQIYVMGDNRGNSKDSRVFGPISADFIIGTCVIRFYPFDRFGTP